MTQISLAAALLFASAGSLAQNTSNQISLPKIPAFSDISIDLATMAAQQEQAISNHLSGVQEKFGKAARSVLGMSAEKMNPDELEAALAARIPGFAGWVHHENGASVMRMAGIKASDAATALSRSPQAAAFAAATGSKVNVQAALWDSHQLLTFKNKASNLMSGKGVVGVWINREINRVEVLYNAELDAAGVDALSDRLAATGIPRSAMVLTPSEVARSKAAVGADLDKQPLPLAGGSKIAFVSSSTAVSTDVFYCTLGIPAIFSGVTGFVTASHCSNLVFGGNIASLYYGGVNYSTFLGNEGIDPPGFACNVGGVSIARGCRYSDALFVANGPASAMDFGRLLVSQKGSLKVKRILDVVGTQDYPTVKQTVYKTGATTGTTSAKVVRSCVNRLMFSLQGEEYVLLCAAEVESDGWAAPGDSGSPVWLSSNGAIIAGIVSHSVPNSNIHGFSPWGAVVKELGTLTVTKAK